MSPAPSRRLLPALVASLAVHGLFWLMVDGAVSRTPPRPPAPRASDASLEWVEVEVTSSPSGPQAGDSIARAPEALAAPSPPPRRDTAGVDSNRASADDVFARAPEALLRDAPRDIPRTHADDVLARAPGPFPKQPDAPARDTSDNLREDTPGVTERPLDSAPSAQRADASTGARALSADAPRLERGPAWDIPRATPTDAPRADLSLPSDSLAQAATPPAPGTSGSRLLLAARAQRVSAWRSDEAVPEERKLRGTREPATPQALVEDLVAESVGRGKVDRGLVHPYFSQLGKTLLAIWDADRSVKEHGLQGYFDMGMERSRAYARVWGERAANYGASGAFAANKPPEEDRRRPASHVGDPTLRMRQELREKMREEFRATRRALIRVVQDREGRLLDVDLVEPSQQPEVDQEAMKDVRAAAMKLPPPPSEAVGTRERIISLWEFELILSISPPIPVFTFEFDEALGFIDTRLPLDKRIYKRVRLVEIR
ncbi:TonB family C-terminal domain-containing protein [Myxococcus fulvus]|uniref:TonB family C-terminal domain-containing protein n=1 Tax=Myxococcus fulvus TaxID=33 RepID=A0A511TAB6_MYXFU|nr:TonB C-terminal domain-containing protein [Myxococcus fulvus]GEN11130.1 hypothetical protein MFU01_61670 [Myxococcus fulvus]SET43022.1 TonB family C-terminal domain-containing protein [Myxococcus fulvus]